MKPYKCFSCGNSIKMEYLRKKIRCPYCGSKILYKVRSISTTVEAV